MGALKRVLPVIVCCLLLSSCSFASSIGQAKATALSGDQVTVEGAVTYLEPAECYIESADRSAGIWVQGDMAGTGLGGLVKASGTYTITSGEPCVIAATISPVSGNVELKPFAVANSSLGGYLPGMKIWDHKLAKIPGDGCEWQWTPAAGAANVGLLVKTWGMVNGVYYSPVSGAKWFYIDDGAAATADFTDKGILVYSDADVKEGQNVAVTGISSVEPAMDDQSKLIRVLRARQQ